jgi:CheY-like chemotaxis protein
MTARTSRNAPSRVLLIDDDLVSREVMATVLSMAGYSVHTAEDGAAAVALLAPGEGRPEPLQPDAILMDAQMPGLSGTALIAALRARTGARIFAVSGSQPPDEVVSAADGFFLKPFTAEALAGALEGDSSAPGSAPSLLDAGDPVVSAEILAQLRTLMPEAAVRNLYETVVADLGRRIDALAEAMAKGNSAEVRRIGHTIKGGCGMAGAVEAARLGALIEAWGGQTGDNHLDNTDVLLRDLRTAARRLKNMLDAGMPA